MNLKEVEISHLQQTFQEEHKLYNQTIDSYLILHQMLHDDRLFPEVCYIRPLQELIDLTEKKLRKMLMELSPKQSRQQIVAKLHLELVDVAQFRRTKELDFLAFYIYQVLETYPQISISVSDCMGMLLQKLENLDYELSLNQKGDECIVVKFRKGEF